jgi:hypothetical protein
MAFILTLRLVFLYSNAIAVSYSRDINEKINQQQPTDRSYLLEMIANFKKEYPTNEIKKYDFDADIKLRIKSLSPSVVPKPRKLLKGSRAYPKNLTLIVDMDETLLHCSPTKKPLATVFVFGYSCIFRPHWKEFLIRAAKDYELILWSYGKYNISNF